jgi:tetratricopeptide (TPR) repeat protein
MRAVSLIASATVAALLTSSLAAEDIAVADSTPQEPANKTVEETATGGNSVENRIQSARKRLAQLSDEQRYDEAEAVALQILRLTQEEFGEDAKQVIEPLLDLAAVQINGANLATAEQNLSAAIRLIEQYNGPLSAGLIEPLTTLGEIYNQSGLYEKAARTFARALRLNHVNLGFTNFEQFPIMDGLTDSYMSQKDIDEATFYQSSQLEIQQRRRGIDNHETAPGYYKLARWYSRINRYDEAIMTYQKADRVVREALGKDSPERTEGLQGLALLYQKIGNPSASSSILRKALKLVEESPENDPLRRASLHVAIGDNLIREGRFSLAQEQYAAAWEALPDNETGAEHRNFYFNRTVRLEGNLFPKYATRARGKALSELKTGSILIDYSLNAQGRVKDPSVVESNPPELMDRSFLSIYRRSLFRPHLVDGVAQPNDGLLARHEFYYIADQEPDESDNDADGRSKPNRGKLSYPDND